MATVYWITQPTCERLGIMPRPRGNDWLSDDIDRLKHRHSARVVVSLLTPQEIAEFKLEQEPDFCETHGITFYNFPIPDLAIPTSYPDVIALIHLLKGYLDQSETIIIHCRMGIGRSGLITSAILVASGIDPNHAMRLVSDARRMDCPETDAQKQWVRALRFR